MGAQVGMQGTQTKLSSTHFQLIAIIVGHQLILENLEIVIPFPGRVKVKIVRNGSPHTLSFVLHFDSLRVD